MGGDCLNTGCVPSKSLLASAHLADRIRRSDTFGLESSLAPVKLQQVMNRVHQVIDRNCPPRLRGTVSIHGSGSDPSPRKAIGPHTVQAGDRTLTGKNIVIATGSGPQVPKLEGLESVNYITNETSFPWRPCRST
jgi:pyruvate/2-oxoglutarate dehydrogenase complex dihydrolipoamide dehydrogenase (E3) component